MVQAVNTFHEFMQQFDEILDDYSQAQRELGKQQAIKDIVQRNEPSQGTPDYADWITTLKQADINIGQTRAEIENHQSDLDVLLSNLGDKMADAYLD